MIRNLCIVLIVTVTWAACFPTAPARRGIIVERHPTEPLPSCAGRIQPTSVNGLGTAPFASRARLESHVGKTAYVVEPTVLRGSTGVTPVWFGEPVLLCRATGWNDPNVVMSREALRTRLAVIKTRSGRRHNIGIRRLSGDPPRYNLRAPRSAPELLVAAFREALWSYERMQSIRARYGEAGLRAGRFRNPRRRWDYRRMATYRAAFRASRKLASRLFRGTKKSTARALRQARWLANADQTVIDWYTRGIRDLDERARYAFIPRCFSGLEQYWALTRQLRRLEHRRSDQRWRRGLEHVPDDKLARVGAIRVARIERTMATLRRRQRTAKRRMASCRLGAGRKSSRIEIHRSRATSRGVSREYGN